LIFESIADEEDMESDGNQNGEEGMSLSDKIINNRMIESNYGAIKKRIFVKEKYLEDSVQGGAHDMQGRVSMMSKFISQNIDLENDFLIPAPHDNNSLSIKIKIYFFSTPNHIKIHVTKKNIISDIIRHIMTLYQKEPEFSVKHPL
jgi:hypothetical protein